MKNSLRALRANKIQILFICIFANHFAIAQYIGFGTTTPTNQLSVNGNANFTGNVGIGTTAPALLLQVEGDARIHDLNLGRGGSSVATNTAFGFNALINNAQVSLNVAMGNQAMSINSNGANNVAYGSNTLVSNTNGNNNTAIGRLAMLSNITGSNNTAVGYSAGVTNSNYSNTTTIGANAIASASNSFILGNNANVGIGTSSPSAKLEVVGTTSTDGLQLLTGASNNFVLKTDGAGNASWACLCALEEDPQVNMTISHRTARWNGSALVDGSLNDDAAGIGLGIVTPAAGLDIRAANIGLRLWSGSTTGGSHTSYQIGRTTTDGTWGVANAAGEYANDAAASNIVLRAENLSQKLILNAGSGPATFVATNNKVGIGITSPVNTLDVKGKLAVGNSYSGSFAAPTDGAIIEGNVGIGTSTPLSRLHITDDHPKTDTLSHDVTYLTSSESPASNPFSLKVALTGGDDLTDRSVSMQTMDYGSQTGGILVLENAAGNVGIGTSSPTTTLDVQGGISTKYSGVIVNDVPINLLGTVVDVNYPINPSLPPDWDFDTALFCVNLIGGMEVEIHRAKIIDSNTVQLSLKYFSTDEALVIFNWVSFRM